MRLPPHKIYLMALGGRKSLGGRALPTKKEAHEFLCRLTGQNFGFDVDAWKAWINENRNGLYPKVDRQQSPILRKIDLERKKRSD